MAKGRKLKIFSFFAGCGILDLGFEKAGYRSLFGKRFTGGFAYGIGVEYGRFLIGGTGRVGCTSWNHSEGFIDVAFEIGYRF